MNATATIAPARALPAPPAPSAEVGGPQHMRALERANKVRLARAELKRRVAAGEASVCEVILACPWEADSMAIGDLLMSQRRWGQTRCRKFLTQIPMSEQKTIGSMTERQRRTLAALLSVTTPVAVTHPWLSAATATRPPADALSPATMSRAALSPPALVRSGG
jgi:hypothetical protein